jgi:hypothetical protein
MNSLKKLDSHQGKWFKHEQVQMKNIHRLYRDAHRDDVLAYRATDLALLATAAGNSGSNGTELMMATGHQVTEQKAGNSTIPEQSTTSSEVNSSTGSNVSKKQQDPEWYLPKDSPLRSEKGEMLKPAFISFDYNTFIATSSSEYWRQNFVEEGHDRLLTETAEAIVSHICSAQTSKELRVRHGSAPLGRFWRAKREQITPLALVMHELKLWATNRLRVANIMDESTHLEISRRIKYIQGLQKKEVWGPSVNMLRRGMRPVAHDKLFRLLLITREDLARAKDYAFRGYCRRRSREKLLRLENLLKNVFLTEIRLLSMLMSMDEKLTEPTTKRLQPTDLLNSAHNQVFVDYSNVANVCLRALCDLPLVRKCLLSDFSPSSTTNTTNNNKSSPPEKDLVEEIATWPSTNLFISRFNGGESVTLNEAIPELKPTMPLIYDSIAEMITNEIKNLGDKRMKPPPNAKTQSKNWTKHFETVEDGTLIIQHMIRVLASLQDLIPSMVAVHEFFSMAGEGGDFTVYDTLRLDVIQVMGDAVGRVYTLQCAERNLVKTLNQLSEEHSKRMELRRLKTKKAEYDPCWVTNLEYCTHEILPGTRVAFSETFKQTQEIARDAWDYSLTAAGFDDKVNQCRRTVAALLKGSSAPSKLRGGNDLQGDFALSRVIDLRQSDWISKTLTNSQNSSTSSNSNGALIMSADDLVPISTLTEPISETARYNLEREALEKEAKALRDEYESSAYATSPTSPTGSSHHNDWGLGGQDLEEEEIKHIIDQNDGKNPFAEDDDDNKDDEFNGAGKNPFGGAYR